MRPALIAGAATLLVATAACSPSTPPPAPAPQQNQQPMSAPHAVDQTEAATRAASRWTSPSKPVRSSPWNATRTQGCRFPLPDESGEPQEFSGVSCGR